MSARKLQQEFDKTNKKIAEGLGAFDDIYDKLMTTEIASQKEKLELDLKKEIKKLQRSRDQLKQWLGDGSIKLDKNLLQENRTKIEHAMDLFKDLEKSSKIKQFSNEGLELQSQRLLRFNKFSDPEDYKKHEQFNYISDVIEQLHSQNDGFEDEIHGLSVQLKRAKSSHALSIQTEIDEAKYKVERNGGHIKKLEMILRGLENDNLDPDRIDDIKDDLEYYVENNNEEDYVEYDDFYEQLDIDDDSLEVQGSLAQMALDGVEAEEQAEREAAAEREASLEREAAGVQPETATSSPSKRVASVSPTPKDVPKEIVTPKKRVPAPAPALPPMIGLYSEALKVDKEVKEAAVSAPVTVPGSATQPSFPVQAIQQAQLAQLVQHAQPVAQETVSQIAQQTIAQQTIAQQTIAHQTIAHQTIAHQTIAQQISAQSTAQPSPVQAPQIISEAPGVSATSPHARFFDTIPRLSILHQSRLSNPLPFESVGQLLESSLLNCPDSFDAEKPRQYNPVTIHPSLIDYPQEPMYELNLEHVMRKFDNDTLFFCFYYSEGSDNFAKWNAARELSRRGWAFHGETHQWFQKDAKQTRNRSTEQREGIQLPEVEEENYKYFDYEKTWLTRRKDNYRFTEELRYQFV